MNVVKYLTAEGKKDLQNELHRLTSVERVSLAARLRDAIQMGDLSENADYKKAKEDQGFLEGRIQELEYILKNSFIIDNNSSPRDVISLGSKITIQEDDFPPEIFVLVGATEADPRNGKISNESPMGLALLDHKVGETIKVTAPGGDSFFKILKIE